MSSPDPDQDLFEVKEEERGGRMWWTRRVDGAGERGWRAVV